MSQDQLDNSTPEFTDDFAAEEENGGGFMTKIKGLFKKSGSDDAFGKVVEVDNDPFAMREREDAQFEKRKKVMGVIIILAALASVGAISAIIISGIGSSDHTEETIAEHKPADDHAAEEPAAKDNSHTQDASSGHSVTKAMPSLSGPEDLSKALIQPPINPDMARRMGTLAKAPAPDHSVQPTTAKDDHTAHAEKPDHADEGAITKDAHTPDEQKHDAAKTEPAKTKAHSEPKKAAVAYQPNEPSAPSPRSQFSKSTKVPYLSALPKIETPEKFVMAKAPAPNLQTKNAGGQTLPTVDSKGNKPWKVYALPHKAKAGRKQISVVFKNLGLSNTLTTAAVLRTRPQVTLAFSPYAPKLNAQLLEARKNGHETLLTLGMESEAFPVVDPGPDGLFTTLSQDQNKLRLERSLARATSYLGVLATGGDRYTASEKHFTMLMKSLKSMGLLYLAPTAKSGPFGTTPIKPAHRVADITISADAFHEQIVSRLVALEDIARKKGAAVIVIDASPMALSIVIPWMNSLAARNFQPAPLSAVITP